MKKNIQEDLQEELQKFSSKVTCSGTFLHGNNSVHGYDFSVIKSGGQKFPRRKMLRESLAMDVEALTLSLDANSTDKDKVSIQSNYVNRRTISFVEDTFDPSRVQEYVRLLKEFQAARTPNVNIDAACALLKLTTLTTLADKGRLPSAMQIIADPPRCNREFMDKYSHLLEFDSDEVDKTFLELVTSGSLKCIKLVHGKMSVKDVFTTLKREEFRVARQALDALEYLEKSMKAHKEKDMIVMQAIAFVALRHKLDFRESRENYMTPEETLEFIKTCLNDNLIVPEFCFDMHTKIGASTKKTPRDFALEGSLVVDEIEESSKYRNMYVASKSIKGYAPKPISFLKNTLRATI